MHISQLLHALLRRPDVEVVGARLPERPSFRLVSKQIPLAQIPRFAFGQKSAGRALFRHLHHSRESADFRLRQEQMNVFWHHDIPDDHEPVTLASLFQNRKEGIAAARSAQKRQSPVARASDKVQVMSAVSPMQAAWHSKPYLTGGIVPALAKNARTGHPLFWNGKEERGRLGHPPTTYWAGEGTKALWRGLPEAHASECLEWPYSLFRISVYLDLSSFRPDGQLPSLFSLPWLSSSLSEQRYCRASGGTAERFLARSAPS
jgi:hypothetical protein